MIVADVWHSHHWIDFRDWLGAVATAAAAIFAAWSIYQSRKQAQRSAEALVAERRADYTISLLRELAESVSIPGTTDRVRLLIKLSPARLPTARAFYGVEPTPEEVDALAALFAVARAADPDGLTTSHQAATPQMFTEIKAAIDQELDRRPELMS